MKKLLMLCTLACSMNYAVVELFSTTRSQNALQTFKQKICTGNVVVDFYADWCGPCKSLAPIFKKISDEWNNVTFLKVNTETYPAISKAYGVRGIPHVMFFKNGKKIASVTGNSPKDIRTTIKKHFK